MRVAREFSSRSQSRQGSMTLKAMEGNPANISVLPPRFAPISHTRVHLRLAKSGTTKLFTKPCIWRTPRHQLSTFSVFVFLSFFPWPEFSQPISSGIAGAIAAAGPSTGPDRNRRIGSKSRIGAIIHPFAWYAGGGVGDPLNSRLLDHPPPARRSSSSPSPSSHRPQLCRRGCGSRDAHTPRCRVRASPPQSCFPWRATRPTAP